MRRTQGGMPRLNRMSSTRSSRNSWPNESQVSDVVITTALIPGRRAPVLISEEAVKSMRPGSVVVDLAAEQGGNCALTEPGKTVVKYGVTINGTLNLPSLLAPQASQMYARNVTSFLLVMLKDGKLNIDLKDDLVRGPLVVQNGEVLHPATKTALEGRRQHRWSPPSPRLTCDKPPHLPAGYVPRPGTRQTGLQAPPYTPDGAHNAISSVSIVARPDRPVRPEGRLYPDPGDGGHRVLVATNIVSGFMITERILRLFKQRKASK